MLLSEAVEYVRFMTDADASPSVDDQTIERLLGYYRLADENGNAPDSPEWEPTFWLPRVVAEVFAHKVTLATSWVDSNADGVSFTVSQAVESLRKNENRWRRRAVESL